MRFTFTPLVLYALAMTSYYLYKKQYVYFGVCLFCLVAVILSLIIFLSQSIFDYVYHDKLKAEDKIPNRNLLDSEIIKWRNLFRHPLVLPQIVPSTKENKEKRINTN